MTSPSPLTLDGHSVLAIMSRTLKVVYRPLKMRLPGEHYMKWEIGDTLWIREEVRRETNPVRMVYSCDGSLARTKWNSRINNVIAAVNMPRKLSRFSAKLISRAIVPIEKIKLYETGYSNLYDFIKWWDKTYSKKYEQNPLVWELGIQPHISYIEKHCCKCDRVFKSSVNGIGIPINMCCPNCQETNMMIESWNGERE